MPIFSSVEAPERRMPIGACEETRVGLQRRGRAAGTGTAIGQEAPASFPLEQAFVPQADAVVAAVSSLVRGAVAA